jgi:hypothetical protein
MNGVFSHIYSIDEDGDYPITVTPVDWASSLIPYIRII